MLFLKIQSGVDTKLKETYKVQRYLDTQNVFINKEMTVFDEDSQVNIFFKEKKEMLVLQKTCQNDALFFIQNFEKHERYKIKWVLFREKESKIENTHFITNYTCFKLGKVVDFKERLIGIVLKECREETLLFLQHLFECKDLMEIENVNF